MNRISSARSRLFIALHLLFFCSATFGFAQNDTLPLTIGGGDITIEKLNEEYLRQVDPDIRVYGKARELRDFHTAIYALHKMLLKEPGNRFYQDSLAAFYFYTGQYQVCQNWISQVLEKRTNDNFFLNNLSAGIFELQGKYVEALGKYEAVNNEQPSIYLKYKIASLQFQTGRFGECENMAKSILDDSHTDDEMIRIHMSDGSEVVPMKAAVYNLLGNLYISLNRKKDAIENLEKALDIKPGFSLAQNNLDALKTDGKKHKEK